MFIFAVGDIVFVFRIAQLEQVRHPLRLFQAYMDFFTTHFTCRCAREASVTALGTTAYSSNFSAKVHDLSCLRILRFVRTNFVITFTDDDFSAFFYENSTFHSTFLLKWMYLGLTVLNKVPYTLCCIVWERLNDST